MKNLKTPRPVRECVKLAVRRARRRSAWLVLSRPKIPLQFKHSAKPGRVMVPHPEIVADPENVDAVAFLVVSVPDAVRNG